jgi:molecular chaperone HtpG
MKGMAANPASLENISRTECDASDALLKDTAFLLLDQAKIIEGEPLKNPSEFVRRMSLAIEKGLLAG